MNDSEFRKKLKIPLTDQQWAAVTHIDGPVLVLAVPGSGKTTTLICRIGYMILCRGIEPERILALSYTRASAADMGERFREFFGDGLAGRVRFRTINSLAVAVMQEYSRMSGKRSFRLAGDIETGRILADSYRRHEGDFAAESDIPELRRQIAYIKNMELSESEIRELESDYRIAEIYRDYEAAMRQAELLDFDDQLRSAKVLLEKIPSIRSLFRERYPYILVDEAQDSSKIQHGIFKILAAGAGNICEVGDEDQSIYGFRAACPGALLSFEQDFPGAEVLYMEDNFRSCREIVGRADRFIGKNTERHEKHMRAFRKDAGTVRRIRLKGRSAQYSYLMKTAGDCRVRTAVLYRNNESALPLIDLLEREQIPYSLKTGEMNFFTNRVIQDIKDILCFALDPKDTELFLRIYYKISTYLTKEAARKLADAAKISGEPVLAGLFRMENVPRRLLASAKRAAELLRQAARSRPSEALTMICGELGYLSYSERSGLDISKIFLLFQLSYRENTVSALLGRLDTLSELVAGKKNEPGCLFLLSTIHGSKGLEYDRVYLMDMLDGILPEKGGAAGKRPSDAEKSEYEEARRLFYVAATRAKNELSVFTFEDGTSPFAEELLKPLPAETSGRKNAPAAKTLPGAKTEEAGGAFSERNLSDGGYEEFLSSLHIGQKLRHRDYGECEIEELSRNLVVLRIGDEEKKFSLQFLYLHGLVELPGL